LDFKVASSGDLWSYPFLLALIGNRENKEIIDVTRLRSYLRAKSVLSEGTTRGDNQKDGAKSRRQDHSQNSGNEIGSILMLHSYHV
jgi:hypothetical protein